MFIDGSVKADLPMQRLSEIFNVNTFIVSQVNPYIIPFLAGDGGGILGSQSSISGKIIAFLHNEISHITNLFNIFGVIPDPVERVAGIAKQEIKGHVTIHPKVRLSDYLKLLRNPTPEYLQDACEISQQNTYPKVGLIKAIYEIEREINN